MDGTMIETNGIELHVVEAGSGPAVVLCHGFPELAYSWRHQIPVLAEAGYRVLAPDMRGYGRSSRPAEIDAYDMDTIAADLAGLLDAVGEEQAVFVGHDFGGPAVWHMALARPERVRAVAGLSVPHVARAPVPPLAIMRHKLGEDFYIVWFQQPGPAEAALARDVRRTLCATDVWSDEWAGRGDGPSPRPRWLSEEDLDFYVESFERTGFAGGLNYYRNIDRNWEAAERFGDDRIEQPAMFLVGERDAVRAFMPGDAIESLTADLRANVVVEGAGHWIQQECPDEVNAALLEFLAGLD